MSTSAYISHICPLASFACTLRSKALSFQLRVSTHSPLHSSLRCRRPPPMSSDYAGTNFPANKLEPIQLNDESDFYQITSPDGFISISGFGSLLSENSARSTFPNLINFRVAKLRGFRRVFAHVAPIFFERGIAKPETKEISSLSVEPCEGETLIVTVFEIKKSEIPAFIKREHEFRFLAVLPETLDGKPFTNRAVLCARSSDEEFFQIRCKDDVAVAILYLSLVSHCINPLASLVALSCLLFLKSWHRLRITSGSKEIYFHHYGRYNIDKIWRDDILPCRVYLRHCVLAAKNLGDEAYNNFLDHTFLGDRKTTIREYLATTGAGIMEEAPPESLKTRYGG
ncbi:hypothetical protein KPL71_027739 [Citrus sinensis]|nr:hypothetical protein KPL71_027739 [Citrus sinensis]